MWRTETRLVFPRAGFKSKVAIQITLLLQHMGFAALPEPFTNQTQHRQKVNESIFALMRKTQYQKLHKLASLFSFIITKTLLWWAPVRYLISFTSETLNRKSREELKYATRTMVAIVFTYLSCNVFSVFMSVMENVFPDSSVLYNADGSR